MKIAIELQPIFKQKSGVGWYTYNLIKQLNSKKINVIGQGFNFLGRNSINKEISELQMDIEICKYMPYGIYSRIWNYVPVSYNLFFHKKAAIYHFFNFVVPPNINGKVVVTVHDMVYKKFPETMDKRNLNRLEKNLKRSLERADIVITVSQNSKKEIIEYLDIDPQKIKIVYNGVDGTIYRKSYDEIEKNRIKQKYNLPNKYVLYLGTLEPRKNIESIIAAFALNKSKDNGDLKLVIAGKKGWMFDSIFEKVKEHRLENDVIFTGYVEEEDKPLIYKMSELFIFPSLYEGFGVPVLEAMASGVPVITSNTSSLPEAAGDAGILVDPNDIIGLSNAMKNVLENEDLRMEMIEKGLKQSMKFSWEKSAEKLIEIYKEVGKDE